MDDDVVCEPEGIIRAITFGDLARRPTIVGGHMFSIYSPSRLHSFGEIVQPWRFWWQSPPDVFTDWDFAARNLRSARWLHKRIDVDFNGWFMCLIPREVLDEIGLSLPLFIKWDDSEFGLRAKAAGYPTVTFPGAAVWHVPWTDKNDALDWQAYFHHRNRFVAALLHSPYPRGGRMVRESLNHQIKHLVSMQYSTVELRHQALEDVLAGPDRLHDDAADQAAARSTRSASSSATRSSQADPDAFPPVRRKKPPRKGKDGIEIPGRLSQLVTAGPAPPMRQLRPTARAGPGVPRGRGHRHGRQVVPPGALRLRDRLDARRHLGGALPARPRRSSATCSSGPWRSTQRLRREWPTSWPREYRAALGEITSPEAWEETFRALAGRRTRMSSSPAARRSPCRSLPPGGHQRPARGLPAALPAAAAGAQRRSRRATRARSSGWSGPTSARWCGSACSTSSSGSMIGRGTDIENFAIHLFAGMVVVHFFTETFNGGTRSLVSNRGLIVEDADAARDVPGRHRCWSRSTTPIPMLVILTVACLLLGLDTRPDGHARRRCSAS